MHARWLALALVACSAPPKPIAAARLLVPHPDFATVTGRVLLLGQPVHYFGIVSDNIFGEQRSTPVSTTDGRFVMTLIEPGDVQLLIVGNDFEPYTTTHTVAAGQVVDAGDLEVQPGHGIAGTVRDERGRPVAGARVEIASARTFDPDEDRFVKLAAGDREATTDANGGYEINGVSDYLGAWIRAELGDRASKEVTLEQMPTTVDLVIAPAGSLEVHTDAKTGTIDVGRVDRTGRIVTANVEDGPLRIGGLPPGDYRVKVQFTGETASLLPRIVHVAARQHTTVTANLPSDPITLTFKMTPPHYCGAVTLKEIGAEDMDAIAAMACEDGTATIENVTPGKYLACASDCLAIEVKPSPALQVIDLSPR